MYVYMYIYIYIYIYTYIHTYIIYIYIYIYKRSGHRQTWQSSRTPKLFSLLEQLADLQASLCPCAGMRCCQISLSLLLRRLRAARPAGWLAPSPTEAATVREKRMPNQFCMHESGWQLLGHSPISELPSNQSPRLLESRRARRLFAKTQNPKPYTRACSQGAGAGSSRRGEERRGEVRRCEVLLLLLLLLLLSVLSLLLLSPKR